jgi:hypothetical protein
MSTSAVAAVEYNADTAVTETVYSLLGYSEYAGRDKKDLENAEFDDNGVAVELSEITHE